MNNNILSPRKLLRLTIVGDHKSGKTTILNSLVNIDNDTDITTNVELYVKLYDINGIINTLHIWDTMGHPTLISLNNEYYKHIDCLIIVFDINDRKGFENVTEWYNRFKDYNKQHSLSNTPLFILLGNIKNYKFREVSENEAKACAKSLNMTYYEISARNNISVDNTFQKITKKIINQLYETETHNSILESCCTSPRDKISKTLNSQSKRSCFSQCFCPK